MNPCSILVLVAALTIPANRSFSADDLQDRKVTVVATDAVFENGDSKYSAVFGHNYGVEKVDGDRLWVPSQNAWIDRRFVVAFEDAPNVLSQRIDSDPSPAHYVERGQMWTYREEYAKALEDFEKALATEPDYAHAFVWRGFAFYRQNEFDKAIDNYTAAIQLSPAMANSYVLRGDAWAKKGQLDRAINDVTLAIEIDQSHAHPYARRGLMHLLDGNLDDAVVDFETAIELQPTVAEYWFARGLAYRERKELTRALEDMDRALAIGPKEARFFYNRGDMRQVTGDVDGALADFNEAIQLDDQDVTAYVLRALLFRSTKQYTKAREDFDRAISISPKDASILNNRAWLLATCPDEGVRDGAQAVVDATKAVELGGLGANGLDTLAAAYAETGQFDKAAEAQLKAIEQANEDQRAAFNSRLELYRQRKPFREQ